ncbi:MAG: methyltransferase domain-containing protein [Patescibacteria group bacterium]
MPKNKQPEWDRFFEKAVKDVLSPNSKVLDIGAGLRIDSSRGNEEDSGRAWIKPLIKDVTYHVMDQVDTYHPDFVGDIMSMPFEDESYDSIICLAVLEHVPRPWDAMSEMFRVLKPGGKIFVYVPFLSPYHAMPGYYGDYFRYTEDGIRSLCEKFTNLKIAPVRGPIETLAHLLPGKFDSNFIRMIGRKLDGLRKSSGKQVSGYNFTATKPHVIS